MSSLSHAASGLTFRISYQACCDTIRSYYGVRCPGVSGRSLDPTVLLITGVCVIACGVVTALLRSVQHPVVRSFPEAAGCILAGAVAGLVVRWGVPGVDLDRVAFDEDLFLSIFLPPIIFQATLAIDKAALGRHVVPVATFAVLGTFLSAALTGSLVYAATLPLARPIPALDAAVSPPARMRANAECHTQPNASSWGISHAKALRRPYLVH